MPADSDCGPPEPICTLRKASGIDRENTAQSRRQCHHDALPWPEDSRATPVHVRISTCEVYAIWLRVYSRKSAFTLPTCHQNAPLLPTPRLPPAPRGYAAHALGHLPLALYARPKPCHIVQTPRSNSAHRWPDDQTTGHDRAI